MSKQDAMTHSQSEPVMRRKKKVTFGYSTGTFYEANARSRQEQGDEFAGEYSRSPHKRKSIAEAPIDMTKLELNEPAETLTSKAEEPTAKGTKLERHFGVTHHELKFLTKNQKVLKFFGEAPPPSSYQPEQKDKAIALYNRYIEPGAICGFDMPLQARENIRDRIEAGKLHSNLFDHAQKHAMEIIHGKILPEFLGRPLEDEDSSAVELDRIMSNPTEYESFIKYCKVHHLEDPVLFYRSVEDYKLIQSSHTAESPAREIALFTGDAEETKGMQSPEMRAAKQIYNMYVRHGALREISAAPDIKNEIRQRIDDGQVSKDLFDKAQKHVLSIMRIDILPKFLDEMPTTGSRSRTSSDSRHSWTLDAIFKDKNLEAAFLSHCKRIYSEENALFYLEVEKFRQDENSIVKAARRRARKAKQAALLAKPKHRGPRRRSSQLIYDLKDESSLPPVKGPHEADAIFETFIQSGSIHEISLPGQLRQTIEKQLKQGNSNPYIFDDAQKHVFNQIFVDHFPKFQALNQPKKRRWSLTKTTVDCSEGALREVLADRVRRKAFLRHLQSVHCHELILFWESVERYRDMKNTGAVDIDEGSSSSGSDNDYEVYANSPRIEEEAPQAEMVKFGHFDFMGRPNLADGKAATDDTMPLVRVSSMPLIKSKSADSLISQGSSDGRGKLKHVKSILKDLTPEALSLEAQMKDLRMKHTAHLEKCVAEVKKGANLIKYDARRRPIHRRFAVSPDGTELMWGKPGAALTRKKELAEVIAMHYGPFSERFRYFDCSVNKSWMCVVIEFEDRTIDLVFSDERQLDLWFLGLQSLAPLNITYMSRGAMLWARANMKIDKMAYFQQCSPDHIWVKMLRAARSECKSSKRSRGKHERKITLSGPMGMTIQAEIKPKRKSSTS